MSLTKGFKIPPYHLNETIKLPVFYFLLAGSFASWQSLFNVYLDGIGYSSMQIGTLNAVFISTSALVVPFWGIVADKFGNYRVLLLLTMVCALLVYIIGQTIAFHWMLLFILIISVFHQPGGAVVDGMTMGFVRNNQQYSYGQFRLWGSAGWAVFSLLTGYIAAKNTHNIFYFGLISFSLLSLFNLLTLPEKPLKNRSLVNFRSFAVFFNNGRLMVFLLLILFSGIAVSPLHQFINLYYKDIGASNSFLGWVFFVQAIIEIPTFLLGVWLLRRSNPEVVILVSLLISGIRMFCYSFISDPLIAISFSAFHGITIAFFLIAVVEYVQSHTPDHLRTTGQALIWAFHYGAGVTFGNLILGYVRDHSDMLAAMRLHAIITAFVLIASALFFSLTSLKKKP